MPIVPGEHSFPGQSRILVSAWGIDPDLEFEKTTLGFKYKDD
jgi:hypothetical protein